MLLCLTVLYFSGTCEAWLSGKRRPFGADLFGSICFAVQHGKFSKSYGDLTRLDARLDLPAASDLVKGFSNTPKFSLVIPRLNLILQQQVLSLTFIFFF
ncbi:hypothetical protein HanIR_Chr01g0020271 [Helianthus annuus]|nr:hypothetical protein HanIR_Chr01g0020271 [Helianthus annuus]